MKKPQFIIGYLLAELVFYLYYVNYIVGSAIAK